MQLDDNSPIMRAMHHCADLLFATPRRSASAEDLVALAFERYPERCAIISIDELHRAATQALDTLADPAAWIANQAAVREMLERLKPYAYAHPHHTIGELVELLRRDDPAGAAAIDRLHVQLPIIGPMPWGGAIAPEGWQ
jgi:hypothetical protein